MRGFELTSLFSYLERQIYNNLMKRSDHSLVLKSQEIRWQYLKHMRWQRELSRQLLLCLLVPITTLKKWNQIRGHVWETSSQHRLDTPVLCLTCSLRIWETASNPQEIPRSYEVGKHLQTQQKNRKILGFFSAHPGYFFLIVATKYQVYLFSSAAKWLRKG